jgi:hypothetical protein
LGYTCKEPDILPELPGATETEQSRAGEKGERSGWDQRDQIKPKISDMRRADRVAPSTKCFQILKDKRKEAARFISICLREI